MIENPLETRELRFYDWDDSLLGVLIIPKIGVSPEKQAELSGDVWENEKKRQYEAAKKRHPRRRLYPVEKWCYALGENGLRLERSVCYKPIYGRENERLG